MKTWQGEMLAAGFVLFGVAAFNGGAVEWVGACAVLLTFGHMQVSDRLAEREALKTNPEVDCHRWSTVYLCGKELLWVAYFAVHQSWAALVGVPLFLLYPAWRRWWRSRHPVEWAQRGGS